jgi:hypothetical protein
VVGDGTGGFGTTVRIDVATSPLAVEPQSLALGDVDGDGRIDACGRDSLGTLCATAASGFAAARWSTMFAHTGPATTADRSMTVLRGGVCGLTGGGFTCTDSPGVFSSWPASSPALWSGDLDGDGMPDWCSETPSGMACSRMKDRSITTNGESWTFSLDAMPEFSLAQDGVIDATNAALGDVSGDGRTDACAAVQGVVRCAISQGYGFGPRATMLSLPTTAPVTGLWLGDLDGDGKDDVCADDGATIRCATSP